MRELLNKLNDMRYYGETYEERNSILRMFGCNLLTSFFQLDNQLAMAAATGVALYPWDLKVHDVDPAQRICLVSIYLHPSDVTLHWWLDIDTVIECGNNPVINKDREYALDMAWMCKEQGTYVLEAMLIPPVMIRGEERFPELEAHIDYLLQVLYGVRGYEGPDGKMSYIATDIELAESWCRAMIHEAEARVEGTTNAKRWYAFSERMDRLKRSNNKLLTQPKVINRDLVDKLAGLL